MRVEKLVAGGEGLARVEGVPVFIPRAAPGDLLRVRLTERHPDYGRAEIADILEPGPGRRPDPFPELSRTGIADLQHLRDELQPFLKAEAVRETLEQSPGEAAAASATELITGEPWGYRLRTQLHTEIDPVTGGVRVGYHARGTNDVIPLTSCPLLVPELEAALATLPGHLGADAPMRLDVTVGAAGDFDALSVAPIIAGLPHSEVSLTVGGLSYAYDARSSSRPTAACCRGLWTSWSGRGRGTPPTTSTPGSACSRCPWRNATGGCWRSSPTRPARASAVSTRGATG